MKNFDTLLKSELKKVQRYVMKRDSVKAVVSAWWTEEKDEFTEFYMIGCEIMTEDYSERLEDVYINCFMLDRRKSFVVDGAENWITYHREHRAEESETIKETVTEEKNEEEVNTMTTENTTTTTAAETAETEQQKTDRENREHCKRIADDLEAVAEGRVYKCPECGELVGIENLVYDEDAQTYTCTQCGKTFDECDLEPVGMLDYFADVLDIEYRIGSDRDFRSVRLLVAYGGPNIYVDTWSQQVELYWWTDRASFPLSSEVCDQINAAFEELFNC